LQLECAKLELELEKLPLECAKLELEIQNLQHDLLLQQEQDDDNSAEATGVEENIARNNSGQLQ
jgi:hypothetical protein